ncbi:MAG TPA: sulfur carrier protein ThiS [Stellaceae bacterium]|nr:sulfur carrier protein ThiS [Stellaceae bacterium]
MIIVNGKGETLACTNVAELLRLKGIEGARGLAVAVNGVVVPAKAWPHQTLNANDTIEIVRPFGGG